MAIRTSIVNICVSVIVLLCCQGTMQAGHAPEEPAGAVSGPAEQHPSLTAQSGGCRAGRDLPPRLLAGPFSGVQPLSKNPQKPTAVRRDSAAVMWLYWDERRCCQGEVTAQWGYRSAGSAGEFIQQPPVYGCYPPWRTCWAYCDPGAVTGPGKFDFMLSLEDCAGNRAIAEGYSICINEAPVLIAQPFRQHDNATLSADPLSPTILARQRAAIGWRYWADGQCCRATYDTAWGLRPAGSPSHFEWHKAAYECDQAGTCRGLCSLEECSDNETFELKVLARDCSGTFVESESCYVKIAAAVEPAVVISADPAEIFAGQSATLTWAAVNAETAEIDQGIGPVATSGSVAVAPNQTTTYTIIAAGPGGTAAASATVAVRPAHMSLVITYPAHGQEIMRPDVMVRGEVINAPAGEVGIAVNGVVALVCSNRFAANHVPLTQGQNTLEATATAADGTTAQASCAVSADLSRAHVLLSASSYSGNSPLVTKMTLAGQHDFVARALTWSGPEEIVSGDSCFDNATRLGGIFDCGGVCIDNATARAALGNGVCDNASSLNLDCAAFMNDGGDCAGQSGTAMARPGAVMSGSAAFSTELSVRRTPPGLYIMTAEATDQQGSAQEDSVAILVQDRQQLDSLLKEKWDGMKAALAGSNIDQGLGYISAVARERYSHILENLAGHLPVIAGEMQEIEQVYVSDGVSKYRIQRSQQINGEVVPITYYIYFGQDGDGLWRIESW